MDDLISREAAIEAIKTYCKGCDNYNGVRCRACNFNDAMIAVDSVSAVDAEPVRHGRWTEAEGMMPPECHDKKRCSVCANFALHDRLGRVRPSNYCPNCGAKMDNEKGEE